jgi:hypothetical protein
VAIQTVLKSLNSPQKEHQTCYSSMLRESMWDVQWASRIKTAFFSMYFIFHLPLIISYHPWGTQQARSVCTYPNIQSFDRASFPISHHAQLRIRKFQFTETWFKRTIIKT